MLPYEDLLALPPRVVLANYDKHDAILYALGVGVGADDPLSSSELQFIYEQDLKALPTMAVVIGDADFFLRDPLYDVDWCRVLHGEQRLRIHKSIEPEGSVKSVLTLDEIYDKGPQKGALLLSTRKIYDQRTGELLATMGATYVMRGDGGFGGSTASAPSPHQISDRAPDLVFEASTRRDQALLYRLSGDMNPLHADPAVADSAGFGKPILHGLCTYGVVGRAILTELCGDAPERLRQYDVRFSAPVYPGDRIQIEVWIEGKGRASLRAHVEARDQIVLDNGFVQFAV